MLVAVSRINNFEEKPGAGNIAAKDFKRVMALMASPPSEPIIATKKTDIHH